MTRFVYVTVLLMVLTGSRVASAQATGDGSLPGGTTVAFQTNMLYIHEDGSEAAVLPRTNPDSLWKYFNLAHCQCGKAQPDFVESKFEYLLLASSPTPPINEPLNIWVGTSCSTDVTTRNMNCHPISGQAPTISTIQATNNVRAVIPIYDAMNPEPSRGECQERVLSATIWGLADSTIGSGMLDYSTTTSITTDSQAPPLPSDFRASGGESAIQISWTPNADTSDVFAYQALCARADDDGRAKTSGRPPQRYMTATTLCGIPPSATESVTLMPVDIPAPAGASDAPDAGAAVTLAGGLTDLDPTFLCGEETSATATSLTIDGLQNGVAYKVALLVVDKYQNARGVYFTSTMTPVPATDFWEDLHGRGSKTEGGLCLLAETYGDDSFLTNTLRAFRDDTLSGSPAGRWLSDAYYATMGKLGAYVHGSVILRLIAAVVLAPLVMLALLWHWLTLPGVIAVIALVWLWRRRRRAVPLQVVRVAALAVMTMVALAPGHAHAGGYQPYWEASDPGEDQNQVPADAPSLITWHAGIRLGPYIPDIDKQFGMEPGPYKQMFGGARVLPMLDVDRILWTGFGQIGVGGSVGYMQKSAHEFTIDSLPTDNPRARGSDINKFRLIPLAVTATYRFTWLDDQYGIPVVPYIRGGLAYYLWWVSVTNGSLAKVCKGDGMEPSCSQDKALGGSLGVQGSIGLAIRAERIDSSAATSMRQSGIEHAGIYGELSLAKVDGFGSDTKLSVGDRTWFAGVDFEF